jgi:undecaprenyl-diphosphatase
LPLLHVVILALVQGITEFLPISSSGHLVLAWEAFDAAGIATVQQSPAERLSLDIAVHVGTLLAVCLYFWRDIGRMGLGLTRLVRGRPDPYATLAFYIVVGTIPLGIVGFLFREEITLYLHDVRTVAWATIGFGVLLFIGDRLGMTLRRVEHMTFGSALWIGLAQVLALIPGTSRSGITMTMARVLGFERSAAARFSLLLAIPAIAAPGLLVAVELYQLGNVALGMDALLAAGLSFLVALVAIWALLGWLRRATFTPFVIYRILLGAALLYWSYAGL